MSVGGVSVSHAATGADMSVGRKRKEPWGPRIERMVIEELLDHQQSAGGRPNVSALARMCADSKFGNVSRPTMDRWWQHFQMHGELPSETKRKAMRAGSKRGAAGSRAGLLQSHIDLITGWLEANPHLYVDQLQEKLADATARALREWNDTVEGDHRERRRLLGVQLPGDLAEGSAAKRRRAL